jgi:hypothetical protein
LPGGERHTLSRKLAASCHWGLSSQRLRHSSEVRRAAQPRSLAPQGAGGGKLWHHQGRHLRLAAMARSSMRISSALSKFLERFASIQVAMSRWCSSSSLLGVGAGREGVGRRALQMGRSAGFRPGPELKLGFESGFGFVRIDVQATGSNCRATHRFDTSKSFRGRSSSGSMPRAC